MEGVEDFVRASRRSGVAEVCWTGPDGGPKATAVVPLQHDGLPALALHFSQWDSARELVACPEVAWVLSDSRLGQREWQPGVGYGRMRLVVDPDGTVFDESMLDQELRKYPPSRAFADSAVLRKEHWWYLPRLILVFQPERVHGVAPRTTPDTHGVLAVAGGDRLQVETCDASDLSRLTSLGGRDLPPEGEAVLLLHDFSVPDLERWGRWPITGSWDGSSLSGATRPSGRLLPNTPGIFERVRRHRTLERECVRALRDIAI